jgi:RHS repeat-associated protein
MAMKVRYTVVDGEILSELRGGVKRDYVPDPLGSTVALLDSTQTITDTFSYWPYGESAGRTGTTATPFQYVGSFGYYQDGATRNYVRARYLSVNFGCWITVDPKFPDEPQYQYANNNSITYQDSSGMEPRIDSDCPNDISKMVKNFCGIVRKPWDSHTRGDINDCIRKSSSKNGVSCNGMTPERVECMRNYCRHGALKCEKCTWTTGVCASTPGFGRCPYGVNYKDPVGPTIWLCLDTINAGGCRNYNPHVPPYPHTFIHETGHSCGIAHVDDSHDRKRQCNDIFSCCMYEVLFRNTKGSNCWKYIPRSNWKY